MTEQRGRWILPLVVIPLIVTVVGGVIVYWLTEGRADPQAGGGSGGGSSRTDEPEETTTDPPQPLSVLERLAGEWLLVSWVESPGPVTLYVEAREGNLTITEEGDADWRLDIDEVGESHDPQPAIACGGRLNLDGQVEPVPGGGRNRTIDWTADLRSANFSSTGEDRIIRALCGWATIGTRAPYDITTDGDGTRPAETFEMRNEYGRFVWQRAE